jgi:predicted nucleic acid-binding protein
MTLNKIPDGEICIIDANIMIYAFRDTSQQCKKLLERCADNTILGIIGSHILAEIMHRLMIAEARENNWITTSNPAKQLSDKPERVKLLYRYEQSILNMLAIGIHYETVKKEDFITAMKIQHETGLLTNDALTVAIADRLGIHAIASADKHLQMPRKYILYRPTDINA